jgi:hypothetical protein
MTHDTIFKPPKGKAYQYGSIIDEQREIDCQSCNGTCEPIWDIQAPSLPLCPRGGGHREGNSCPGYEGCLYCEVVSKFNSSTSATCKEHRTKLERYSSPGPGGFSAKRTRAWLGRKQSLRKLNWSMFLTDWHGRRWFKHIGF